ncbi:hypothetical protein ACFRI7_13335 [Streptomyces sp. NPDC056716]|uniref:hypothetical protein n=1 Tax=unclassified Streptomyces TaxID=2593676 RepID=UPI0036AF9977
MGSNSGGRYTVRIGGSVGGHVVVGDGNKVVSSGDGSSEVPDPAEPAKPAASTSVTADGTRAIAAHTVHTAITGDHNTVNPAPPPRT